MASVEGGVLSTLYNIIWGFDFNIVVQEVIEVLAFEVRPPILFIIFLLLAHVLDHDVFIVVYVLEH